MTLRPCIDCRRPSEGTRCPACRSAKNRVRDQVRGSSTARGYDAAHEAERDRLAPVVAAGKAYCAEPVCLEELDGRGRWIQPGAPWHLAHDRDTGRHRGPAHARCNLAEAGRYATGGPEKSSPRA